MSDDALAPAKKVQHTGLRGHAGLGAEGHGNDVSGGRCGGSVLFKIRRYIILNIVV